ncbi:MAG: shikimate dehydrogenase [Idiomarina sp.]|nr:shikimate dehydrogenase [Idiomarina sp.]
MIPLAVFGDPIGHSLSPQLHQLFASQAGIEVDYRAILAPPATFAQQLRTFFEAGGVGANITLPHKVRVMQLVDKVSDRAQLAGAANTLSMHAGKLVADNTDGAGLVADLSRQLGALAGLRVLILGAGGAVRGIVGPLLDAGCKELVLRNRTAHKAQAIIDLFRPSATRRVRMYQSEDNDQRFDIVINAVSSGHQGPSGSAHYEAAWLKDAALAYDLSYGAAAQPFLQHIEQLKPGLASSDGLGMLAAQGAASFAIWTGHEVEFTQALRVLRESV